MEEKNNETTEATATTPDATTITPVSVDEVSKVTP